ncbi:Odorant receptor Or96, partial [Rhyzopertha dominica]
VECFPFFRKIMMLYYNNVWIRLLCKFYLPSYFVTHVTMMFLKGWNVITLFDAAIVVVAFHAVVVVILIATVEVDINCLENIMLDVFWPFDRASDKLNKDIHVLNDMFKFLFYISLLSIVILGFNAAFLGIHPEWPIVDKNNLISYATFLTVFIVFAVLACIAIYVYAFMFFYFCVHGHVQMRLLIENLRKISGGLKEKDEYQHDKLVRERILFIIRQHFNLTRFTKAFIETFEGRRLTIPLLSGIVFYSIMLYVIYKERNYTMIAFIISFFLVPSLYCFTGELLSSEFENFTLELYKREWYNWDRKNRQTILLFLLFSQKERTIYVFPPLTTRIPGILWILRNLYSIFTLIQSVSE